MAVQNNEYIDTEEKIGGATNDNNLLKDAQQDDTEGMLKYGIDMESVLGVEKTSEELGGITNGKNEVL